MVNYTPEISPQESWFPDNIQHLDYASSRMIGSHGWRTFIENDAIIRDQQSGHEHIYYQALCEVLDIAAQRSEPTIKSASLQEPQAFSAHIIRRFGELATQIDVPLIEHLLSPNLAFSNEIKRWNGLRNKVDSLRKRFGEDFDDVSPGYSIVFLDMLRRRIQTGLNLLIPDSSHGKVALSNPTSVYKKIVLGSEGKEYLGINFLQNYHDGLLQNLCEYMRYRYEDKAEILLATWDLYVNQLSTDSTGSFKSTHLNLFISNPLKTLVDGTQRPEEVLKILNQVVREKKSEFYLTASPLKFAKV